LLVAMDAVLLVVLGGILFSYIRNKRRDTAGVSDLVKTIKEHEPAQLETLRTALKEQYGQSDEDAAENAKKLAKVKKTYYKYLITAHLGRNGEAFAALDPHLNDLIMAYRTLMPVEAQAQPPQEDAPAAVQSAPESAVVDTTNFQAALDEIKRQNDELKKELEETKHALDAALNEYASAYSGGAEAGKERLENEKTKLHNKKESEPPEQDTAPTAPANQQAGGNQADAAPRDSAPPEPLREDAGETPITSAKEAPAGQSQDEIDQLMDGIPNLDGIQVQEIDGSEDGAETAVPETADTAGENDMDEHEASERADQPITQD